MNINKTFRELKRHKKLENNREVYRFDEIRNF